jgi:uncharacterized protein (TIGR00369 family)
MSEAALSPAQARIAASPYARFLGVRVELADGKVTGVLPFSPHLIGNTVLPALHGGVVAAFLELTALAQLAELAPGLTARTVDVTVDYLRSSRAVESFARAEVLRLGRRVANLRAVAWQGDERRPVATLRGHFRLGAEVSLAPLAGSGRPRAG